VIFPGVADMRTLELVSAIAGDEPVHVRSVTKPMDTAPLLRFIANVRLPEPTATTSVVWRRRIPVDAVARGWPGGALLLSGSTTSWVGITPWWEIPYFRERVLGPGN
jgi:hypothetical protein